MLVLSQRSAVDFKRSVLVEQPLDAGLFPQKIGKRRKIDPVFVLNIRKNLIDESFFLFKSKYKP